MKQVIIDQEELAQKKEKSPRHQLAERISKFVCENDLTQPYGGGITLSKQGRPHYSVLFCRPRTLDGLVSVYSHNFIVVQYHTAARSMPPDDRRVFESEENLFKFLRLAFVEFKADEALAVPVKEKK